MRFFEKEFQNGEEQNSTKTENTLSGFDIPQRLSRLFARSEPPQSLVDNPEAEKIFHEHNLEIEDLKTACQAEIDAVLGSGAEESKKPYRATTGPNDPIKENHKRTDDLLPEKDLSE